MSFKGLIKEQRYISRALKKTRLNNARVLAPSASSNPQDVEFQMDFSLDNLSLVVVSDYNNTLIPILRLNVCINTMNFSSLREKSKMFFQSTINCTYYNYRIGQWEPLMEDYSLDLNFSTSRQQGILAITNSNSAKIPLNINVTPELMLLVDTF